MFIDYQLIRILGFTTRGLMANPSELIQFSPQVIGRNATLFLRIVQDKYSIFHSSLARNATCSRWLSTISISSMLPSTKGLAESLGEPAYIVEGTLAMDPASTELVHEATARGNFADGFHCLCRKKILDNQNCGAHTPLTLHNRAGRARSLSNSSFQDLNGVSEFPPVCDWGSSPGRVLEQGWLRGYYSGCEHWDSAGYDRCRCRENMRCR